MSQKVRIHFVLIIVFIIFSQITCAKPSKFKAKIPEEPPNTDKNFNDLIIQVTKDGDILFDKTRKVATIKNLRPLADQLKKYWEQKDKQTSDDKSKGSRGVIIMADKSMPYADVVKVIDVVKNAGADPVGLSLYPLE